MEREKQLFHVFNKSVLSNGGEYSHDDCISLYFLVIIIAAKVLYHDTIIVGKLM